MPMTPSTSTVLRENVPLANLTSWKVGGPARYLAEPTENDTPELIQWAVRSSLPVYFLGRGSNVLIPDAGLPGLVILTRNSLCRLERVGNYLVAGAGVSLPRLSSFAANEGYAGFEFMIGIPGTVGGAIVMNAGLTVFRPRDMTAVVESFDLVDSAGDVSQHTMADIHADYRSTDLLRGDRMILRARFKLDEPGDSAIIHQNTLEHLRERKSKQPLDKPTAGSTFRSPPGTTGAGWHIEQAGLKGFRIGDAMVSQKHANWIENLGKASAADIGKLINHIQNEVFKQSGIHLEPEVRILA